MKYALRYTAAGTFEDVCESVEASVEAHSFSVAKVHDVHETVARKGFSIRPVRIYEVRDPTQEPASPGDDPMNLVGRVAVFEDKGEIIVGVLRPGVVAKMFPEAHLEEGASDMEDRIARVIADAVGETGELD